MIRIPTLFIIINILAIFGCTTSTDFKVSDLRCENMVQPLGIDKATPRLSWKINSNSTGSIQEAFQILVASEASLLTESSADLWNSGKVQDPNSIHVSYKGQNLKSGSTAWWSVRVWDQEGTASAWSEPARFSIGLLNEDDWEASYITFNTENGYRECPQFYSTFEADELESDYYLHVNSLGYHEVYVNGNKVGTGVLAPAVSQFDKRSLILTYDLAPYIRKGSNELIIWLGSGWYTEGLPGVVNNGPVVKAQLEKINNDRQETILATNDTWVGRKSSYTRHGNWRSDRFGGEIIDGKLASDDLKTETNHNTWQPVSVIDVPTHSVTPQMTEQNIIADTIHPIDIQKIGADTFLIDMGKNLTGWLNIDFPELKDGQEVKMEYCDHLVDGEKFNDRKQYDLYIASGDGHENFINKFNYHGFRYVRLTGLHEQPEANSIEAYLIHTGFEDASGFECSDPDMNAIHDMLQYTLKCLSIGGDFVDCPQIERLGYGGDGNAMTVTAQTMYNLGPLYNHWLQVWGDVIREDGSMPHTAPNPYSAGGGPYWCGFIITASWQTFLNYGDTLILNQNYPIMQKWLGYVDQHSIDGILKQWPNTNYRNWYLGDWATPEGIDQQDERSVDLVNNSFIAVCYDNMERIAKVLGKKEDVAAYSKKKELLRNVIHNTFFDENSDTYGTGTQIDLAFPLISGVVPADKIEAVTNSLYEETLVNRKGHFSTGLVGLPVLTEWAIENREADFMYTMLKKREYPGYLFMLDNGATTTWEHWNGHRSHIHNCYNSIGSWFYQAIGGIRPIEDEPSYRKIIIEPQIPEGITWAKVYKETPFGKVSVDWALEEKLLNLEITIPPGVEAEIAVPSGYKIRENNDNPLQESHDGLTLAHGTYEFFFNKE